MLIFVSWVSFWLDPNATVARVSLGVTTLLSMATQISGINASQPPVSYTKAIDVWTGVCLTFVFGALLEFALVNYASRSDVHHAAAKQQRQRMAKWNMEQALLEGNNLEMAAYGMVSVLILCMNKFIEFYFISVPDVKFIWHHQDVKTGANDGYRNFPLARNGSMLYPEYSFHLCLHYLIVSIGLLICFGMTCNNGLYISLSVLKNYIQPTWLYSSKGRTMVNNHLFSFIN